MATYNKTLHLIASKLGLADEEKVMRKAAEFERLLQTKSVAGSNISDTSKVVICLDLGADVFGVDLDLKMAIKYSGLKPSTYANSKKMIQNLLYMNSDKLTTSILCASLQCPGVQDLADSILEQYLKHSKIEVDLNLPQYVSMAVYHACRLNKVKISKSKIVEKSCLKPAQWNKLDADWTKFVDEHFAASKKKKGRPPKNSAACVDQEPMDIVEATDSSDSKEILEPEIEPYEAWKRRIMQEAYIRLAKQKSLKVVIKKEASIESVKNLSTRRSPRKNLQIPNMNPYTELKHKEKSPDSVSRTKVDKELTLKRSPRKTPLKQSPHVMSPYSEIIGNKKSPDSASRLKVDKELTLRRSPRKTPQKFSPYKTPYTQQMEVIEKLPKSESVKEQPINVDEETSPRKSPRKIVRQLSFYKSPKKTGAVRLLFPS